jgi:hypothetical protein
MTTNKPLGLSIVVAAALSVMGSASSPARADTIYTYTGQDFTYADGTYSTADSVTGYIDLATALGDNFSLAPVTYSSFSFTDGVQTITNATPGVSVALLQVATGPTGGIDEWAIEVFITFSSKVIYTCNCYGDEEEDFAESGGGSAENLGLPGAWATSVSSATPIPAALPLFAGGLGVLGLLGWRRKRKNGALSGA